VKINPNAKTYEDPSDVQGYIHFLIRRQVRHLLRTSAYGPSDGEDLAQELALHAHASARAYHPARGAVTTFYDRIIARRALTLIQARHAQRRDPRRERPLSAARSLAVRPQQHRTELQLDIELVLALLPQDLSAVALRFMGGDTGREAGGALSLTRGQVRHRTTLIRRRLEAAGLEGVS
jgi:DNA-directed RNA polymerase specialized sigma24 family protein